MRQLTWLGLGLIAMFVAISFDYHYIDRLAYPFYGVMLLLLVLVIIVGHSGGGSQRWINLGFFRLQPSEPAKLAIVLVMAKYFQSDEPAKGYYLRDLWVPFAIGRAADFLDSDSTRSGHRDHSRHCFHQHGPDGRSAAAVVFLSGRRRSRRFCRSAGNFSRPTSAIAS